MPWAGTGKRTPSVELEGLQNALGSILAALIFLGGFAGECTYQVSTSREPTQRFNQKTVLS